MKVSKSTLSATLSILLAACGSGGSGEQGRVEIAAQESVVSISETTQETDKVDPTVYSEGLEPRSGDYQPDGELKESAKSSEDYTIENKYLNFGILVAINEYKLLGDSLIQDLKAEFGSKKFITAVNDLIADCRADEDDTVSREEGGHGYSENDSWKHKYACKGKAYAYWALVNGTKGTEGNEELCVKNSYCGYMFNWYDVK